LKKLIPLFAFFRKHFRENLTIKSDRKAKLDKDKQGDIYSKIDWNQRLKSNEQIRGVLIHTLHRILKTETTIEYLCGYLV